MGCMTRETHSDMVGDQLCSSMIRMISVTMAGRWSGRVDTLKLAICKQVSKGLKL